VHSLRDLQEHFGRAMLDAGDTSIAAHITAAGFEPARRLQIYRNNVRANFLATLQATYPVIERLGGTEWFAQSVQRYHAACPSCSGDLQYAGRRFAQFLAGELQSTPFGYFADVARLEWAYQEVLTAAPSPSFSPGELCALDPADHERVVFVPRSALRLVESCFPLLQIWTANRGDGEATVSLDAGPDRVLLIRREDHVELRPLRPATAALLRQFIDGAPFADAAAAAAADCPELDLAHELTELLAMQAIAAIRLAGAFA
jgi:hypothetical protein